MAIHITTVRRQVRRRAASDDPETFAGIFQRLFAVAPVHGLRIITPNRRAYNGTTPYTPEELRVLNSGTSEERVKVLDDQGIYLALFVDRAIQEFGLAKGKVAIAAWSLGTAFLLMLLGAIVKLEEGPRARLKEHVSSIIFWGK
jgi:pimeloyl-ACP methyl ester carboxylesterase